MASQEIALEEIRGRLIRLERQNRRLKQCGLAALIVVASLFFMAQASSKKTIEANEFVLRDTSGVVRARLSVEENTGKAQLSLLGKDGKQGVTLDSGVPGWAGSMAITDGKGTRVFISALPDIGQVKGGGMISLYGQNGKDSFSVFPTSLGFMDSDGVAETSIGNGEFILKDKSGSTRARLFMTEKHKEKMTLPGSTESFPVTFAPTPMLALYDDKGKTHTFMDGDGSMSAQTIGVSDSEGHSLGNFSAVTGYGAILGLMNGKGEQRTFLEPSHLELSDDEGFKAALGVEKNLVTPRTGETHETSAASLLLFDKDKNVIWKAP